MIPLRHSLRHRSVPLANWALIALCTAAFAWELRAGRGLESAIEEWALVPARAVTLAARGEFYLPEFWAPFVTSTFLHAGALHYLSNMLFLWIFGGGVEDRLGHLGYPAFYLAGGFAAGLVHVAVNPDSATPTIGASGAIAAVMGAFFVLYPRAWIVSIIPPLFWLQFQIPALLYLAFWFALQVYMGTLAMAAEPGEVSVAWWAHAGGFAFGLVTISLLGRERAR